MARWFRLCILLTSISLSACGTANHTESIDPMEQLSVETESTDGQTTGSSNAIEGNYLTSTGIDNEDMVEESCANYLATLGYTKELCDKYHIDLTTGWIFAQHEDWAYAEHPHFSQLLVYNNGTLEVLTEPSMILYETPLDYDTGLEVQSYINSFSHNDKYICHSMNRDTFKLYNLTTQEDIVHTMQEVFEYGQANEEFARE